MLDWVKIGFWSVLIGALVGGHYYLQNNAVEAAVRATEAPYKLEKQKAEQKAIVATAEHFRSTIEDLKTKNEKLSAINSEHERVIAGLRNRPTRPSETRIATITEIRESCTGRELYQEDGQFLAGEASRAEKIRVERDYYYNEYEKARTMLENLRNN